MSVINSRLETVYDVSAKHSELVESLRPRLTIVMIEDLDPANGTRPIEEAQRNLTLLFEWHKVVGRSVLLICRL